jgi:hypothetical protein
MAYRQLPNDQSSRASVNSAPGLDRRTTGAVSAAKTSTMRPEESAMTFADLLRIIIVVWAPVVGAAVVALWRLSQSLIASIAHGG